MSIELPATNRGIQASKDTLVADLKRVVGDSDELLKQIASSTSEEFAMARRTIEAKLSDARARIDDARNLAASKVCNAADATHVYISENPWKAVGVASLVGLVAALLLYRRVDR